MIADMEHGQLPEGVRIDRAARPDLAALLALVAESGLPLEGLAEHLDAALVARRGTAPVGCAALELYADGALLRSVAVRADERGLGLGHALTRAAVELAIELGVPALYLLTTTAERFFPRFGFEVVTRAQVPDGVRQSVEFRSACPASAVVMRRRID